MVEELFKQAYRVLTEGGRDLDGYKLVRHNDQTQYFYYTFERDGVAYEEHRIVEDDSLYLACIAYIDHVNGYENKSVRDYPGLKRRLRKMRSPSTVSGR